MTKALLLRKELGEDDGSPVDIFSLAQGVENLTLVHYPMGDNLSGMCVKSADGNCVIAINSAMSLGRQRFSLAHEFYHMRYDDNMMSVCGKVIGAGKDTEKAADTFASCFLIPPAELEKMAAELAVRHEDGKLAMDDVIRIEQYFGVSHQAAVISLKDSKYMDHSCVEVFLASRVRERACMMGYRPDLYLPLPSKRRYGTYGRYIEMAEQAFHHDLISGGKYEELLLDAFRPDLVYGCEDDGEIAD